MLEFSFLPALTGSVYRVAVECCFDNFSTYAAQTIPGRTPCHGPLSLDPKDRNVLKTL